MPAIFERSGSRQPAEPLLDVLAQAAKPALVGMRLPLFRLLIGQALVDQGPIRAQAELDHVQVRAEEVPDFGDGGGEVVDKLGIVLVPVVPHKVLARVHAKVEGQQLVFTVG